MDGIFGSVDFNETFEIDDNVKGGGEPDTETTEHVDDVSTEEVKDTEKKSEDLSAEEQKEKDKEDALIEVSDEVINDTVDNGEQEYKDDGEDSDKSGSNENEESPLTTYATALKDEGVLPNLNLEEFDGTVEGLIEAQRAQFEAQVEEYKNLLPDEVKQIINNYESGVPLTDLINAKSKEIEYNSISEEAINSNKETQKRLVRDLLKFKNIKDVRIDKIIDAYDNTGSLAEEALSAREELVEIQDEDIKAKKEEQKVRSAEFEKQQQAQMDTLFNTINDTEEVVPGMKLNKNMREKIFKNMVEPAGLDERGNQISKVMKIREKNPMNFDVTLNYLAELGIFDGKWDKIVSKQKSNAIKDLEKKITSKQTSLSNRPKKTAKSESILESMRKTFNS